jgi:hypothetical protein
LRSCLGCVYAGISIRNRFSWTGIMPRVLCPGCKSPLNVGDNLVGKPIRCGKCAQVFQVPATAAPVTPPKPQPAPVSAPKTPTPPAPATIEAPLLAELIEDDVLEAEIVAERPSAHGVHAGRPADRSRREAVDRRPFPNDAPRGPRRPAQPANQTWIYVLIASLVGGGLVLLLVCGGLVYWMSEARPPAIQPPKIAKKEFFPPMKELPPIAFADRKVDPVAIPPNVDKKEEPKPLVRLKLPPIPAALPIRAPELKEPTTVALEEAIDSLTVGGGGRFLLMVLPTKRKIAVFDANEAKVVDHVPMDEENVLVAAGMNKFVLLYPGSGRAERFDLLTRKSELVHKLEPLGKAYSFCMGPASDGPVLLSGERKGLLLDLATLKPLDLPSVFEDGRPGRLEGKRYWAGGTGRLFGATGADRGSPSGIISLKLGVTQLVSKYRHDGGFFVVPGPDDKNLYTAGYGLLLPDLTASPDGEGLQIIRGNIASTYLPAHHGPYFAQIHVGFRIGDAQNPDDPKVGITAYLVGSRKPLLQMGNAEVIPYSDYQALGKLGYPGSVHLIPKAKMLAVVPKGRDKLLLHPMDLDAALERADIPYLFATSAPPSQFRAGERLVYQIEAKGKGGGLTYALLQGPPGMTVSPAGLVEWTPPRDIMSDEVVVSIEIRGGDGRRIFHDFNLQRAD